MVGSRYCNSDSCATVVRWCLVILIMLHCCNCKISEFSDRKSPFSICSGILENNNKSSLNTFLQLEVVFQKTETKNGGKPNQTLKQFIFIGKSIQDLIKDEITLFWNQLAEIWVSLRFSFPLIPQQSNRT